MLLSTILNSLKNVEFGICTSQHHMPGTAIGHGSHKKFEDLCRTKLLNYILEAIKNVVISSSTAKEVIARVYLFTSNTVYC
jgi:hypothetical protein